MTLADRTAVVTGAAQGIGAAAAERLARDGVTQLLAIDRAHEGLERQAAVLRDAGAAVSTLVVDLADVATFPDRLAEALRPLGTVDILVNAAGITDRGGLDDITPETFDRLIAVNLRAPLFVTQQAVRHMDRPTGGVIVNICSINAHGGPPFLLAYSASKAGLVALTKNIANTLKHRRIRAFAINLGWTVTPSEHRVQTEVHGYPESWADDFGATQPFGRLLEPRDPAGLIAFLVSDDAAMMTGAVIDLNQTVIGTVDDH